MGNRVLKILLIEDNPGDARLIEEMLLEAEEPGFKLEWTERLSKGIERLSKGDIDIVLLDLSLPDSTGFDTFEKVHEKAPEVAIIVFTGLDDKGMGVRAVQVGAQDYLVKGKVDSNLLIRSIQYAIERQRMMRELQAMSITDDLTRLYNRRGFLTLGREMLNMGKRIKKRIVLLYADLDGFKKINDEFGHQEGDRVLIEVAGILKETFRESDIIARVGGDEFVLLGLIDSVINLEILTARLQDKLRLHNERGRFPYQISMSIGGVSYDIDSSLSIQELLSQADKLMYKQKQSRR